MFWQTCCTRRKKQHDNCGTIYHLDGMPGSGKSSLASALSYHTGYHIISTDDFATKQKLPYHEAAIKCLNQAIILANIGNSVILDSFVTRYFIRHKEGLRCNVILIGLWCPLDVLKDRFDQRAQYPNAHLNSKLCEDYVERYTGITDDEIKRHNGKFSFDGNQNVEYDLFFDTRYIGSTKMAKCICEYHFGNRHKRFII